MAEIIKNDSCTVAVFKAPEGDYRKIVKDYMLEMANVVWHPREDYRIGWKVPGDFTVDLPYYENTEYHGIPYAQAYGNLAEFMEYYDNGKYYPNSVYYEETIGTHCSSSMNQAFGQLIDLPYRGSLRPGKARGTMIKCVGDIVIPPDLYEKGYDSDELKLVNSKKTILEAYASVDTGDILYFCSHLRSGHTRMVSKKPKIVRDKFGDIIPEESIVYVIEQTNQFESVKKPDFVKEHGYDTTWWIDHEYTVETLYRRGFMPYTLSIYTNGEKAKDAFVFYYGNNKCEKLEKISGKIESTFALTYVRAFVKNEKGEVVANSLKFRFQKCYDLDLETMNDELDLAALPKGKYTFELRASVARGAATLEKFDFTV